MKKSLLYIVGCLLGTVLIMTFLYVLSDKINHKGNGFTRFLPSHSLDSVKILDIKFNSYYIAGLTKNSIYLGSYTLPDKLLWTNYNLTDTHYIDLNMPIAQKIAWGALKVYVDSPRVYAAEGITPTLLYGNLDLNEFICYQPSSINFLTAIPISSSSFALIDYDTSLRQTVLSKLSGPPYVVKRFPAVLEKQLDGYFCTSGTIMFNYQSSSLVYMYHYRNQVIYLDTNFNIVRKDHTIDTTSRAKIKTTLITSENIRTFSAPPLFVNKRGSINNDRLYVHSSIAANNEQADQFDQHSVIDVYSSQSKDYKFSFYLPYHLGEKLRDFQVFQNKIVAINDHYLITYLLNY